MNTYNTSSSSQYQRKGPVYLSDMSIENVFNVEELKTARGQVLRIQDLKKWLMLLNEHEKQHVVSVSLCKDKKTLTVYVKNNVYLSEFNMKKQLYLNKIQQQYGSSWVTNIEFKLSRRRKTETVVQHIHVSKQRTQQPVDYNAIDKKLEHFHGNEQLKQSIKKAMIAVMGHQSEKNE